MEPSATASVVGRLAPSPTGLLHLGHARTFLAAWLMARQASGRLLLRMEDIDTSRVRAGMAERAIEDLRWLGLDWDEGPDLGGPSAPYVQSERLERYDAALERLRAQELAYPCTCTRAEIRRAASAPHAEDEGPSYPGTCAGRRSTDAESIGERDSCWRFRVPDEIVSWNDRILGSVNFDPKRSGGDFVIRRKDGGPAYQLAVVVDDAEMGVTQVVRGDDLRPSTARQILLYRALGAPVPEFAHLPLVIGADGRRLSKRDGSITLASMRERGVDPQALIARLLESLGVPSARRAAPESALGHFKPAAVPREPMRLDDACLERLPML